jgi:hypothetical protein
MYDKMTLYLGPPLKEGIVKMRKHQGHSNYLKRLITSPYIPVIILGVSTFNTKETPCFAHRV